MAANHSAPSLQMMAGTLASVSTLLMIVGFPTEPRHRGERRPGPRHAAPPSMEAMSAVSSPQTNAPAPFFTRSAKVNPDFVDVLEEAFGLHDRDGLVEPL